MVGIPATLNGVLLDVPGVWLVLRQPDSFLITTLLGLLAIYTGFWSLGRESLRPESPFDRTVGFLFLLVGPAAVVATALVEILGEPAMVSTAVTAPAGIGLLTLGYLTTTADR
jgi:thiol:disulfide interchange protein